MGGGACLCCVRVCEGAEAVGAWGDGNGKERKEEEEEEGETARKQGEMSWK